MAVANRSTSAPTRAGRARGRTELLSRISGAPDAVRMFAAAAGQLRTLVPYDSAVWRVTDPLSGIMTAPVHFENIDGKDCALYWEHELSAESGNRFRDLAQARVPVAGLWQTGDGGSLSASAMYHDFMRPRGVHDELRVVLRTRGHIQGYVSLFREQGRPVFTAADSEFVGGLVPPLAQRLRSYTLPLGPVPGNDARGPGLLLFDRSGSLQSVNDAGWEYLGELPDGPSTVTTDGQRVPAWMYITMIQARGRGERGDRSGARIRLRSRSGRWLVCQASCLRGPDDDVRSLAVTLEPAPLTEIMPLAAGAYGLSERELEVTWLLAHGRTTEGIAQRLFLSTHTVRDHLKAIFEKVGVSSRNELVSTLFIAPVLGAGSSE